MRNKERKRTNLVLSGSLLWVLESSLLQTYDGGDVVLCDCSHIDLESISIGSSGGLTSASQHLFDR